MLEKDTSARPAASADERRIVAGGMRGTRNAGRPAGHRRRRPSRPSPRGAAAATAMPASTIATSAAGMRFRSFGRHDEDHEGRDARRRAWGGASARAFPRSPASGRRIPCDFTGKPEDLPQLPQRDVQRDAVHEAEEDRLRQEVHQRADAQEHADDAHDAGEERHRDARATCRAPHHRAASGVTLAATMAQVAASGPTMSCREVPKSA